MEYSFRSSVSPSSVFSTRKLRKARSCRALANPGPARMRPSSSRIASAVATNPFRLAIPHPFSNHLLGDYAEFTSAKNVISFLITVKPHALPGLRPEATLDFQHEANLFRPFTDRYCI